MLTTDAGPILDSYAVQDKKQAPVEDNAAALLIDDESTDEHVDPCMICETYGDESRLLLCDGCNQSCHVFCAGLDDIPAGAWFCYTCSEDAQIMHDNYQPRPVARSANPRNPTARQRLRERRPDTSTAWARLWRSVAHRTGIDLEHPFDEDDVHVSPQFLPRRQEVRQWQRRFEVAAHVAGANAANRFRELAPPARPQMEREKESQEEIRAWNAFEKARLVQEDDNTRVRRAKRSRDGSPETEAPPAAERRRKRPRTLRFSQAEQVVPTIAESSRSARASISAAPPERVDGAVAPTFLQSLLDEVESHTPAQLLSDQFDANGEYFPYGVDRGSSPEGSPCASGVASPRSMTPPPPRPNSPGLTTHIEPIFPPAPEFRPDSPDFEDSVERARSRQRSYVSRQSPGSSPVRQPAFPSQPEAQPISPLEIDPSDLLVSPEDPLHDPPPPPHPPSDTKTPLNLTTKTAIQTLVKTALKPLYRAAHLTTDQYTTINRSVSRKLYDRIGTEERFAENRTKWSTVASEEVTRAIAALKAADEEEPGKTTPRISADLPLRGVEAT